MGELDAQEENVVIGTSKDRRGRKFKVNRTLPPYGSPDKLPCMPNIPNPRSFGRGPIWMYGRDSSYYTNAA